MDHLPAKIKPWHLLLQTTNVNIQQAFRAGYEFDNLMVAHEFENVSVSLTLMTRLPWDVGTLSQVAFRSVRCVYTIVQL